MALVIEGCTQCAVVIDNELWNNSSIINFLNISPVKIFVMTIS